MFPDLDMCVQACPNAGFTGLEVCPLYVLASGTGKGCHSALLLLFIPLACRGYGPRSLPCMLLTHSLYPSHQRQDVYRIAGVGTVLCGKIEAGTLTEGDAVVLAPSGRRAEIKSIEIFKKTVSYLNAVSLIYIPVTLG